MDYITRDSFLDLGRVEPVTVEVPEPVGKAISVRPLTGAAAGKIQQAQKSGDSSAIAIIAIADCLCDDKGRRLFGENDLDAIGNIPFAHLNAIGEAVMQNCGMGTTDDDVEQAEGN